MVAAIAGWLYDLWPATPLTFGLAAVRRDRRPAARDRPRRDRRRDDEASRQPRRRTAAGLVRRLARAPRADPRRRRRVSCLRDSRPVPQPPAPSALPQRGVHTRASRRPSAAERERRAVAADHLALNHVGRASRRRMCRRRGRRDAAGRDRIRLLARRRAAAVRGDRARAGGRAADGARARGQPADARDRAAAAAAAVALDATSMLVCAAPGALAGVAVLRSLPAVALQIAVTLGVVGDARRRGGCARRTSRRGSPGSRRAR